MKKILMVDDEPEYITHHAEALILSGYEVKTAAEVDEAYHLLERLVFDLLITDLLMPGRHVEKSNSTDLRQTGVDFYLYVRMTLKLRLPIIVFSAVRDQELLDVIAQKERDIKCNNLHFQKKPVRIREFVDYVRKVVE